MARLAHTGTAQHFGVTCIHAAFRIQPASRARREQFLAGSLASIWNFLQGAIFSPSMHLCFLWHYMRCTLFCARVRCTARAKACLDLAAAIPPSGFSTTHYCSLLRALSNPAGAGYCERTLTNSTSTELRGEGLAHVVCIDWYNIGSCYAYAYALRRHKMSRANHVSQMKTQSSSWEED